MRPGFPAPSHERMTLDASAFDVTGHMDGDALWFGPGVPTWVADDSRDARNCWRIAEWSLSELNRVLGEYARRKEA